MRRHHRGRSILGMAMTATMIAVAAGPAVAGTPDRRLQTAADELRELGITGVQGLARAGRETLRARAGVGDLRRGTPVPLGGHFRMGSDTKTFVAVVVLQLVGDGKLSLDDTVDRWLPGVVAGNGNDGRRITVRQLLQHTSGIPNYTNDIETLRSYEAYVAHRFDHHDPAGLVALAMSHPPVFEPGTGWAYSNTDYVLAGMIVSRVTGHSWAAEVRRRILRPLGLRHTSAPGDRSTVPSPHAENYQQWAPGGPLFDTTVFNPSVADASGSLITTPSDLARFWQALQRGELLRPREMTQLHRTVLAETFQNSIPGARYGLGILFVPNRCGGYWAHGGDVLGGSVVDAVSDDGDRVAVLSLTAKLTGDAASAVKQRSLRLMDDLICGRG